jgi:hypothetical protein
VYWVVLQWPAWPVWTEGSNGHLNASIGDCHNSQPRDGAYMACLHSAGGPTALGWHFTPRAAPGRAGGSEAEWETQLGPGVRWVLMALGRRRSTPKEVYGEYVEAVNLLESEGPVSRASKGGHARLPPGSDC